MRRPTDDELPPAGEPSRDLGVAVTIALSILICVVAFIWIFIELDPFLDDFTGSDVTVTSDPLASPVDDTDGAGPSPSP